MLSDDCKKLADEYEIKVGDVMKLIQNLGNKTNYVLRYKNLLLYLSLGMKLTEIHKALTFKQSNWMKKNILILTLKKENTANSFEKKIKLIINSVYGKTMENLQTRLVKFLTSKQRKIFFKTHQETNSCYS